MTSSRITALKYLIATFILLVALPAILLSSSTFRQHIAHSIYSRTSSEEDHDAAQRAMETFASHITRRFIAHATVGDARGAASLLEHDLISREMRPDHMRSIATRLEGLPGVDQRLPQQTSCEEVVFHSARYGFRRTCTTTRRWRFPGGLEHVLTLHFSQLYEREGAMGMRFSGASLSLQSPNH